MIKVQSYLFNPILSPESKNNWENTAVYNGSLIKKGKNYLMVYRAFGSNLSTIGLAKSRNGFNFTKRIQILTPEYPWEKHGLEDPRITEIDGKYYIFYTAISADPPGPDSIKIALAITTDFITFEKHLITPFNAKAMALFPKKINGKYAAILTANTDLPPSRNAIAYFDNIKDLWNQDFWQKWYQDLIKNEINFRRITSDHTEIGAVPIETDEGWLLIYSHIQNYFNGSFGTFGIEAILLDKENPQKIIGRTDDPILVPQETYELEGMVPNIVFPSGALVQDGELFIYYGAADNYVALATTNLHDLLINLKTNQNISPKLQRFDKNPIINPQVNNNWESRATFNPAAILINEKVHLFYRAMSKDNTSVFGYAHSCDGFNLDFRSKVPIYLPRENFEIKQKPDGFGGCEDPRMTRVGDLVYICYTAYDGQTPPKIALTSISINDFTAQKWNFKKPIIISDPGTDNKDGCLFPELIKGKYVFLHREGGRGILIDHVDSLDFKNNEFLQGEACITIGHQHWEKAKMGIASPPIKTDKGWLLLYHGVSNIDHHYRLGAILMKLDDPTTILGRTKYPILEPEMDYEKYGEVNNVVFPCGAVIKDNKLFVYYGAADKVIGVASGDLNKILDNLN
jgi:predicted GH43/DUF377 family glycosyl hydrolase